MTKTVSAYEARTNLGELMDMIHYGGMEVVVERRGKPMVKITKAERNRDNLVAKRKRALSKFAGVWNNNNGKSIAKHARILRKKAKFIPS